MEMADLLLSLDFNVIWLVVLVFLIILEASTVNLVAIWFALGSLFALLCSVLGAPLWVQMVVFVCVSAIALAVTRPFVKKILAPKKVSTNFDRIIGMTGIVDEDIDNVKGTGYVSVDGKDWMARSESGDLFKKEDRVKIVKIEGVKVYVTKIEED
jgi:membrane protein implicated in regulation of membrane protease activity